MSNEKDAVWDIVQRSCYTLDKERFEEYLALFSPDGKYRITTYSPDIKKDLKFLDHDRDELKTLFENLPDHVRMPGSLMRQISVASIDVDVDGKIRATSPLTVFHTNLEGVTRLYAVGRYLDLLSDRNGEMQIHEREVRLETRELTPGCHVPL